MMFKQLESESQQQERFGEQPRDFPQGQSRPSRPSQCDAAELSNEECAKWVITNLGTPTPCKGLNEEQCAKLLINSWERSFPQEEFPREFEGNEFERDFEDRRDFQIDNFGEFPQELRGTPGPSFDEFNQIQDFRNDNFQNDKFEEQQFLEQRHPDAGFCGDNKIAISLGEECDDGNNQSNDGCSSSCRKESEPIVANVIKNLGSLIRGGE